MDIDPHTLQQILRRIEQQMRCPQCGKKVPVDFPSVRVVSDNAMLLQLKCDSCNAFIVLHASLQGVENLVADEKGDDVTVNASSTLQMSDKEVEMLSAALEQCDGSFSKLFEKYGAKNASSDIS
ncbi:hypothetical protein FJZ28_00690 [Candidatus Peregrinibacteria bacterium]|nr:hypothetical protein [Candidatus Peregrinibacteria bacterium]